MGRFGVELVLVAAAVCQSLGFLITYIIAVFEGHVTPGFPYISDTGGKPPESCIFSLVCSITAFLYSIAVYVRFLHTHQYYSTSVAKIKWINYIALAFAVPTLFGLVVVGSFQDDTVTIAHFIGAHLVFACGTVYMWLQTFISYRVYHASLTRHVSSVVIVIRLLIAIMATVTYILTFVLGALASMMLTHNRNHHRGTALWTMGDGGYGYHVASTTMEWLLGITLMLFFLSFHPDFQRISIRISIGLRHQLHAGLTESTPLTI